MRKLSTIIYGIIIAISISSCSNENNDIFGESPAKRLNRAVKEYTELLCSSESGWAMEYFANEQKKGYTLLIQFRETDGVTIAAKDDYTKNEYAEENSHFKVIADNGPVLSFNTYNKLLHYFADPAGDTTGDNGDGRGHEGDYEFIVMKASDDLIELQGKKRGYTILLRRLPEGQDWEAYLKKLEDVKNSLFSEKIPTLWFAAPNGEKYTFSNPYSGVFDAVPEGGDAISQTIKVPFVIEDNGIRMLKPFAGKDEAFSVQTFIINQEGALICTDENANSADINGGNVFDIYNKVITSNATNESSKATWTIMENEQMCPSIQDIYERIKISLKANGMPFGFVDFGYFGTRKSYCIRIYIPQGKGSSLYYDTNKTEQENTVSFTYNGKTNAEQFLNQIDGMRDLLNLLSTTYTISKYNNVNFSRVKMTSTQNPNIYFDVSL